MTTEKRALKKAKLRHAEYYDFQDIQDRLYRDSKDGKEFCNLIEVITMPENIRMAYRNLKKNHGSHTPGTDKKTINDIEKLSDEQLIGKIQEKFRWYRPQSVRRVEIPKGNGKVRPLGIPTIMDRLVQQCVLQVLEPICEAKFHEHSYGFRPNRSTGNAIAQTYKNMQMSHLHYVVDIDIKGFFDNVNHGKLLKQLWTLGIRDKKLISIISTMLKAEVAGIGFPEKGTPQGGIISPLLSNVVLNELDWWLASQWEEFPTQYPFNDRRNPKGNEEYQKYMEDLTDMQNHVLPYLQSFCSLEEKGVKERREQQVTEKNESREAVSRAGVEANTAVKDAGKAERKPVAQKRAMTGKEKKPSIHERLEINKKIIQEKQGKDKLERGADLGVR